MIPRLCILVLAAWLGASMTPARAAEAQVLDVVVDRGVPLSLSAPASSVFIASPDVADVQVMSPTSIMVFGKKTGETTLLATDSAGHALLHRTVIVSQDLSDLRRELAAAIPGNKIQIAAVPDGIVLTGETRDPVAVEDARKIAARYVSKDGTVINRIQVVGSNQIMIRVRFAEVSRNVENSFGINWSNLTSTGGFVFGLATGVALTPIYGIGTTSLSNLTGESTGAATPTDGLSFSHAGYRTNVNGLLDALAQDGLVTMLAEPNLTAMSGETANFLAGGQVPVPVPQANGTISIQYMSYGISLEFTPTLVGENRINLHVKPEVSELSTVGEISVSNLTAPAFTTRKAETTIELGSGQSFAIAGLLDNDQDQTVNKFPFLGDVPILGPLFRSTNFQNNQSELVIVITPYVVKPAANPQTVALPMDGYAPPTEAERIFGMRSSSADPNARTMSGASLAVPQAPAAAMPAAVSGDTGASSHNVVEEDAPAPAPVTPVVPTAPISTGPAPTGPSGFILE
jgi:pilus assembly protein CpaC